MRAVRPERSKSALFTGIGGCGNVQLPIRGSRAEKPGSSAWSQGGWGGLFLLRPALLLDFQSKTLRVTVEFRRVHALDFSDSGLIISPELDARRILKNVNALGQVIDEEVAGGVARRLVVPESVLVLVPTQDADGFGAAATLVFQVD